MHPWLVANGFTVVKNFLPRRELRLLKHLADTSYASVDNGGAPDAIKDQVHAWGGLGLNLLSGLGCVQRDVDKVMAAVQKRAAQYVGPCRVVEDISLLRRHKESRTLIPWHIDADGAGTASYDPCVNVWLPLTSVGTIAPSLEVIGGSHTVMRSEPPLLASNAGRDQDWIEQRFPAQRRIVAAMDPGDALMFDHFTMHRSQAMTSIAPRISGEFRVTTLGVPPHRAGFAGRWAALRDVLRAPTR